MNVAHGSDARTLALLNGAGDVLHVPVSHGSVEAVVDVLVEEAVDLRQAVHADG